MVLNKKLILGKMSIIRSRIRSIETKSHIYSIISFSTMAKQEIP